MKGGGQMEGCGGKVDGIVRPGYLPHIDRQLEPYTLTGLSHLSATQAPGSFGDLPKATQPALNVPTLGTFLKTCPTPTPG